MLCRDEMVKLKKTAEKVYVTSQIFMSVDHDMHACMGSCMHVSIYMHDCSHLHCMHAVSYMCTDGKKHALHNSL